MGISGLGFRAEALLYGGFSHEEALGDPWGFHLFFSVPIRDDTGDISKKTSIYGGFQNPGDPFFGDPQHKMM